MGSSRKEVNMSHGVCVSAVCVWCVVVEDGTQGVTHVK